MKKIGVTLIIVLTIVGLISTITEKTTAAEEIVIGVALPALNNPFWVSYKTGAEKAGSDDGVKLIITEAKADTATQLSQVESMIDQKVNGIVFLPNEMDAVTAVKEIKAAGIPVITSNRKINMEYGVDAEGPISHTGFDDLTIGKVAGDLVVQALTEMNGGPKGKVAIIQGAKGSSPQIERDKGLDEVFADYPDIKVVLRDYSEFLKEKALALTETWLAANPKGSIDVIVAHDDDSAIGATIAIKEAGRTEIKVVGIGGSSAGTDKIAAGTMYGTALISAQLDGYTGVDSMYKYLMGETLPVNVPVEIFAVTKDNVADHPGDW